MRLNKLKDHDLMCVCDMKTLWELTESRYKWFSSIKHLALLLSSLLFYLIKSRV